MIKSEKKLKELTSLLSGKNNLVISKAIEMLRDEAPFEGVIGVLTDCYNRSNDEGIRNSISEFLNDLKDQSVRQEIITEVCKDWKPETISMLVSSCWQSGMNYSSYSAEIVDVFLKSDYVTAVECMTVIEEGIAELSASKKLELINTVREAYPRQSAEKSTLAHELILILER